MKEFYNSMHEIVTEIFPKEKKFLNNKKHMKESATKVLS